MDGDLLVNRDGVRIVSQSQDETVRYDFPKFKFNVFNFNLVDSDLWILHSICKVLYYHNRPIQYVNLYQLLVLKLVSRIT